MIGYDEIAAAVSHLDDRADNGETIPGIATSFGLDADGIIGVGLQRSLRMMRHVGENAIELMLTTPKSVLADQMLASMWMDGLVTGMELAARAERAENEAEREPDEHDQRDR